MAVSTMKKKKLFGERFFAFLKDNPDLNDVTFCVGPEKVKIKVLSLALRAASPIFEKKFTESWNSLISSRGVESWNSSILLRGKEEQEGISLPDVDPEAFEVFLKLLISDDWDAKDIQEMKLSANTILNIIPLAVEYKMKEMEKVLRSLATKFHATFDTFAQSDEFLQLSCSSLEKILSSDQIPLDEETIFDGALKWAEAQCSKTGVEATGENLRLQLGTAVNQIRFPLMSHTVFANSVCTKGILTDNEELNILKYISLNASNKTNYDLSKLTFSAEARMFRPPRFSSLILDLLKGLQVTDNLPGVWDNQQYQLLFQANKEIAVEGVGFLGPAKTNETYDVTMTISKRLEDGSWQTLDSVETKVNAQPKRIFRVSFKTPVILEATYYADKFDHTENPYYGLNFKIKGGATQTVTKKQHEGLKTQTEGIGFYYCLVSNQLAELRFSRC